ncbi:unnamed protein product [Calicophoron daubneyi]|uniref:Uncharacterized protein n=1 Tax=Calicophoron daubneyi TaxID=300641 RepID=A0AAV2SY62_CALDB
MYEAILLHILVVPSLPATIQETAAQIVAELKYDPSSVVFQPRVQKASFRPPTRFNSSTPGSHGSKRPQFTLVIREKPKKEKNRGRGGRRLSFLESAANEVKEGATEQGEVSVSRCRLDNRLKAIVLQWAEASKILVIPGTESFGLNSLPKKQAVMTIKEHLQGILAVLCRKQNWGSRLDDKEVLQLRDYLQNQDRKISLAAALFLTALEYADKNCVKVLRSAMYGVDCQKESRRDSEIVESSQTCSDKKLCWTDANADIDRWVAAVCLAGMGYYEYTIAKILLNLIHARVTQVLPSSEEDKRETSQRTADSSRTIPSQLTQRSARSYPGNESYQKYTQEEIRVEEFFSRGIFAELNRFYETSVLLKLSRHHPGMQDVMIECLTHVDWRRRILGCWLLLHAQCPIEEKSISRLRWTSLLDWNHLVRLAAHRCLTTILIDEKRLLGRLHKRDLFLNPYNVDLLPVKRLHFPSLAEKDNPFHRIERACHQSAIEQKSENILEHLLCEMHSNYGNVRMAACCLIRDRGMAFQSEIFRKLIKMMKEDPDCRVRVASLQALSTLAEYADDMQTLSAFDRDLLHAEINCMIQDEINPRMRYELLDLLLDLIESGVIRTGTKGDVLDSQINALLMENQNDEKLIDRESEAEMTASLGKEKEGEEFHSDDPFVERKIQEYDLSSNQKVPDRPHSEKMEESNEKLLVFSTSAVDKPNEIQLPLASTLQKLRSRERTDSYTPIRRQLSKRIEPLFSKLLQKANNDSPSDHYVIKDDSDHVRSIVESLECTTTKIFEDIMRFNPQWALQQFS